MVWRIGCNQEKRGVESRVHESWTCAGIPPVSLVAQEGRVLAWLIEPVMEGM